MSDPKSELLRFTEYYQTGLYTKLEVVGIMIRILETSPDFADLWPDVPDWAQIEIWAFLREWDEATILVDPSAGLTSAAVIGPNLIALKNWLLNEQGYK